MKIEINKLDISFIVSKHLQKYKDHIITEKTIFHLVHDIQHEFDVILIELENRQHHEKNNKH